jgi:uncharacterized protein YfaQ (DUF2300 family)
VVVVAVLMAVRQLMAAPVVGLPTVAAAMAAAVVVAMVTQEVPVAHHLGGKLLVNTPTLTTADFHIMFPFFRHLRLRKATGCSLGG